MHNGEPNTLETLALQRQETVIIADITAPPMNLMGPSLVRDLLTLIQMAETDASINVVVFRSADPDYFISHVDVMRIRENREEAARLTGRPSVGLLFHHLSTSRLVTICQIEGRVRGIGSEFALACDMRFAARETAIFGQFEPAFGVIPGAAGLQHLTRLMGRARALEVMLSTQDYDADLAERYGWINRALPADALGDFVHSLAQRVARIPPSGRQVVKQRVNAIALPSIESIGQDSDLFIEGLRNPETQMRLQTALARGLQIREVELNLPQLLDRLATE